MLEHLTPPERTVFVLHDVFQFPFETIGSIVGRTPAARRQLASRGASVALPRLDTGPITRSSPPSTVSSSSGSWPPPRAATYAPSWKCWIPTCRAMAHRAASSLRRGLPRTVPRTSRWRIIGYVGPHTNTTLVSSFVNDQPAVLVTLDRKIVVVLLLNIREGLINHMHAVGDPTGLANASS